MSFRDEQEIIDDLAERYSVSQLALAVYCRISADAPAYSECSLDEVVAWFSRRSINGQRRAGMGEHYSDVYDFAERDLGPVNPAAEKLLAHYERLRNESGAVVNDAIHVIDAIGKP